MNQANPQGARPGNQRQHQTRAGIVVILLAAWEYNRVYRQIEAGNYRPNRWLVLVVTTVVALLGRLKSAPSAVANPAAHSWQDQSPA